MTSTLVVLSISRLNSLHYMICVK